MSVRMLVLPCLLLVSLLFYSGCAADKPEARSEHEFSAVGDGKTDDSVAIQRFIDKSPGVVRFPKGIYRITKTIVIDLDKVGWTALEGSGVARIVMAGSGPAFHFIGTHEGTADPPTFKPNVWERQRMPIVDGLEIIGAHEQACGIQATGTMQLTITRLTVRDALHGIHLTKRNRNVLVSNSHIYKNRGIGIFYDNVDLHQSNIVGCHISYCGQGGVVSKGGNVRNIQVGTCDIESNHGVGLPSTANVLIDSTGGVVGEVAIVGNTIQHNHKGENTANVRILGPAKEQRGTDERREGHVTIANNVMSDIHTNIHLNQARGVVIEGNTCWEAYTHNLLVENSSNVIVGPNNFDRNPRYNYGDTLKATNRVVFRDCRDCTLTGLHLNGVHHVPAGMFIEDCQRFNITNCTILDCDGVGLLLKNVSNSRLSGCLIRDDREASKNAVSLQWQGGRGNQIVGNLLGGKVEIGEGVGRVAGNYDGK